jgi:uncharacterized membrane protein (Fun14 family)
MFVRPIDVGFSIHDSVVGFVSPLALSVVVVVVLLVISLSILRLVVYDLQCLHLPKIAKESPRSSELSFHRWFVGFGPQHVVVVRDHHSN